MAATTRARARAVEALFAEEQGWDAQDYQWDAVRLQVSKSSGEWVSSGAARAWFGPDAWQHN